jgi:choline dehydrogenase
MTAEAMYRAIETLNSLVTETLQGGVILDKIIGPVSTGELKVRTTNPHDNPSVKFNYFKEPEDLNRCVQGMRTIIEVVNSRAFSKSDTKICRCKLSLT